MARTLWFRISADASSESLASLQFSMIPERAARQGEGHAHIGQRVTEEYIILEAIETS